MINLNMSNNNWLQGNVFVKPEDQRELARFGLAIKRTFKNVFVKPNEQRPSLLGLCHGEKTSVFIRTIIRKRNIRQR